MAKAAILTDNKYLFQKLYLLLSEDEDFSLSDETDAELIIADIDTRPAPRGAVTVSSRADSSADIILPLPLSEIKKRLKRGDDGRIILNAETHTVSVNSVRAKLTELEYALFSLLAERGDFVSRAEILESVWHGGADEGIINVYIHYLRAKLERSGEKIIISSRKSGYRIAEKYCNTGRIGDVM